MSSSDPEARGAPSPPDLSDPQPHGAESASGLPDPSRRNDQYAWIEDAAREILTGSQALIEEGEASRISDEAVARLMTAAIRLYAAKSDGEERTFAPIVPSSDTTLTPTEMLTAVSELLRALHLGPMELALWYRRRPDEF